MSDPIRQFFACYFHQDWRLEYDDYRDAIKDFVDGAEPQQLDTLLAFVNSFLSSGNAEEFDMRKFGGYYLPVGDGETKLDFLKTVKKLILSKKSFVDGMYAP